MNTNNIDIKKKEVEEIKSKIEDSASTIIVQYSGITVEEITILREKLKEEEVEFKVLKNNISSRAYEAAKLEELKEQFTGPTAVAFSKEDVTAAARILNDFSKENENLIIKAGTVDGKISTIEEIKELATLPNKEGMLSMFLSVLEAPIRGLAQVTSQIADNKEE